MKTRDMIALICAMAVLSAPLTGCSSNSTSSESSVTSSESADNSSAQDESSDAETTTVTAKITSVENGTVTAEVGEITSSASDMPGSSSDGAGTPPEMPSGDNSTDGSAPDGSSDSMGTSPEKPDGNGGGMGGSTFTSGGETITFTVSDSTKVTLEFLQGSGEGTLDDIAEGAVVDVELDGDNNAVAVTVRNLNAGGGFGGSSEVSNGTAAETISTDADINGGTYSGSGDDENALRIDGATVTLDGITVDKTGGESSNTENGDFYGANAGLLAVNGASVNITGATISTDAVNGNGVFSYGDGTTVNISDSVIRTQQRNSGGIQTTGGGTTNATNLDVETQGNSSAAIRTDRGGGTVNVNGGTYTTNGTGSPAVYCTADITVKNAELTANSSEGVVVEGKNSVALENCTVVSNMNNTYGGDSDENIHAIMIYQSMSGDADVGEAYFSADGGSITALSGDMFYITNTDCTISLRSVKFTLANDTFLRVEGNTSSRGWGTQGANGGDVILTAEDQEINGNILVDSISSLDMTLKGSAFTGAVNPDGEGGTVRVTMDSASTWTLTSDSYVTEFNGDVSQITANGYHLYVNGEAVV